MTKRRYLTSSSMTTYRQCPRLYQYVYDQERSGTEEQGSLRFGSVGHKGLEKFWLLTRDRISKDEMCERVAKETMKSAKESGCPEAERFVAVSMMMGYIERWYDWSKEVVVIDVEREFNVPLYKPDGSGSTAKNWNVAGKIDVVIRLADGRLAVMEHKTSSAWVDQGSPYVKKLSMNNQISLYWMAMEALGQPCDVCLYDILIKPDMEPLKATPEDKKKHKKNTGELYKRQREKDETMEEFMDRTTKKIVSNLNGNYIHIEVNRLDGELQRFSEDAWHTAWEISDKLSRGHFPRNPDACFAYNRECAFVKACRGQADINDDTEFRYRRAHSELETVHTKD